MRLIKSIYLSFFWFFALSASAQTQIPFNGQVGIEMKSHGNTYTWVPAQSGSGKGLTFASNAGVSTVEPKMSGDLRLPYANKASNSKLSLSIPVDPSKVSTTAAQKLKSAAASMGASPYLAVASIGCAVFCDALIGWGLDQLKKNEDGSLSVEVPDLSAEPSTGLDYRVDVYSGEWSATALGACQAYMATFEGRNFQLSTSQPCAFSYEYYISHSDRWTSSSVSRTVRSRSSSCPVGSFIVDGVCSSQAPNVSQPLETYLQSNYTGKGWDHHWAKMTAAIVASGGNVFTDGTSTDIRGGSGFLNK